MAKILCLHGRRQSGSTFASKLFDGLSNCETTAASSTGLVTVRINGLEFVFPDGPIHANANVPAHAKQLHYKCQLFSWWSDDLKDAEQALEAAMAMAPDAVGICGFSQGGAVAAVLCMQQQRMPRLRAAVFLSSYFPKTLPTSLVTTTTNHVPPLPSLHVYGLDDQVVRPALSENLRLAMGGLGHPLPNTGHVIPPPPFGVDEIVPWLTKHI